ncbi:MaoC/PaaZ C-terminal domain-containing protein [Actinokineospora sp. NBRC 105648]|uniref:MaoC/PaaZ C-terminal domain-containing protein n=1 Tax=Actinokineospora sp. NBRC 105648 TaxID=3032206 RepID=UPI0024A12CF5|nr:MaoC/PaaZ C-terminal domain-containing protein [Actinokineospora sp. NBRC 105648]GLZ39998.1 MaoC family dehydratase [Actinokineospora sp. NBRC 105648]
MSELTVGDVLPPLSTHITRADLVRYAGAALDFNPIHWNEAFARGVGLPDVIAHGMLTMALAGRVLTAWGLGELVTYSARFTRPVVVPNDDTGALLELTGKIGAVNDDGTVRVNLDAKFDGRSVLGKAIAIVRPA